MASPSPPPGPLVSELRPSQDPKDHLMVATRTATQTTVTTGQLVKRPARPVSLGRRLYHLLCRVWFAGTFALSITVTALLTRIVHAMIFLSKRRREMISAQLAGLGFKSIFFWNPQIHVEPATPQDEPHWDALFENQNKAPFIVINHTSQLDSIVYSACLPTKHISHVRTLAKSTLFGLPFFGQILSACGHFPVFFQNNEKLNDFSVDKQAQERVGKLIDEHISSGGGLALFPEGQINRSDSRSLQSFRRGAFEAYARRHDMDIYGFLHTGVDQVWPTSEPMGGLPATIRYRLFKVPPPPPNVELAHYVEHIQRITQLELSLMLAIDEEQDYREIEARREALTREIYETMEGDLGKAKEMAHAVDRSISDARLEAMDEREKRKLQA